MNYKPYAEYKDSGIEWIGEIPKGWEVKKLKYLCELRNEKTSDENKEYIALEHIESMTGRIIKKENDNIQPEGDSICFYKGDVLFCKLRPYLAKCILAQFDGKCTSELLAMKVNEFINEKYLFYIALSEWFIDVINSSTYGSKMPRASWDFIGELLIAFPNSKIEQTAIADYLDTETAKIASIIAAKQKLIEKLQEKRGSIISHAVTKGLDPTSQMKPSGIEWIGDIPEGWEVKKLKYVVNNIKNGTSEPQVDFQTEYPVSRIETISGGVINFSKIGYVEHFNNIETYRMNKGDILLSHINSLEMVGNCAIYEDNMVLYSGMNLLKIEASQNISCKWLLHIFKSTYFSETVKSIAKHAINQVSISTNRFNVIQIPLPLLPDQIAIANYLDTETSKIDNIIAKTRTSIDKLNEYKTALISACVTGKIDVRGQRNVESN